MKKGKCLYLVNQRKPNGEVIGDGDMIGDGGVVIGVTEEDGAVLMV